MTQKKLNRRHQAVIGTKIGHLTVIEFSHRGPKGRPYFLCKCSCGRTSVPRFDYLTSRKETANCGCKHGRCPSEKHTKKTRSEEYKKQIRNRWYKHKYNITLEDYNQLKESQHHRCKICRTHEKDLPKQHPRLVVDHCHKTQEVRGLLCNACNSALGFLREDLESIGKMMEYLSQENNNPALPTGEQ